MFRNHMWNAMTQPPRLPPMAQPRGIPSWVGQNQTPMGAPISSHINNPMHPPGTVTSTGGIGGGLAYVGGNDPRITGQPVPQEMLPKTQNPNPMPPAAGFMPGKYTNMAYQMAGFPQGMVMRDPTTPPSLPPQAMPPVAPPPADIPMPAPWDILRGLPRGGLGGRFGGIPRLVRPV